MVLLVLPERSNLVGFTETSVVKSSACHCNLLELSYTKSKKWYTVVVFIIVYNSSALRRQIPFSPPSFNMEVRGQVSFKCTTRWYLVEGWSLTKHLKRGGLLHLVVCRCEGDGVGVFNMFFLVMVCWCLAVLDVEIRDLKEKKKLGVQM